MASGFIEVEEKHLSAPISQHVEAYLEDLERAGRSQKYREILESRVGRILDECGWQTLSVVRAANLTALLARLKSQGLAAKTVNEYLNAANAFLNWCVAQGRLSANPVATVQRTDQTVKARRRRALTLDEIRHLLGAAGPRRLLYLVAVTTGLRRGELEALQWGDLRLDSPRPFIALRAEATKARRADSVPLRQDVAAELRAARPKAVGPENRVFGRIPRMRDLRPDFDRVGIPDEDAEGRKADFHSLRVTLGSMLAKSGVAPRTAMELMRHTDLRLTMNVYTDPSILNTSGAVEQLPDFGGADEAASGVRTGTYDVPLSSPKTDARKVLPKSTVRPVVLGHTQAHSNPSHDHGNAYRRKEMVEAVGIEPTSGCL
ncbi:MAG: tyrosine-type recombinase/integrase [Phycisphaerae bacterium]